MREESKEWGHLFTIKAVGTELKTWLLCDQGAGMSITHLWGRRKEMQHGTIFSKEGDRLRIELLGGHLEVSVW